MLTITLQPQTPEQFAAALELLQRIRDDQAALPQPAQADEADEADEVAPAVEAPKAARRTRKSAPADVSQNVEEANTSPESVRKPAESEHVPKAATPAPVAEQAPETPAPSPASPASPSEQTYTLEQVRARLAGLSTSGKREEVKDLLNRYGATRLTEIKPDDYAAVMAEAEGL